MATEFEQNQIKLLKEIKALLASMGGNFNGNSATSQVGGGSSSEIDKTSKIMASLLKHNREMYELKKQILEQEKKEVLLAEKMKKLEDSRKKQAELIKDLNAIEAKQNKINGVKKQELAKLTKEELKNEQKNLVLLKKETEELKKQLEIEGDLTEEKKKSAEFDKKTNGKGGVAKTLGGVAKTLGGIKGKFGAIMAVASLNPLAAFFIEIAKQGLAADSAFSKLATTFSYGAEEMDDLKGEIKSGMMLAAAFGMKAEDMVKAQNAYIETTGRVIKLTGKEIASMGALGMATGLGYESATQLLAEYEQFGLSLVESGKLVEKTINISKKSGVSATNVSRKLSENLKIANSFTFKRGLKGVSDMSVYSEKLKINMTTIASLADKISNPEGAIETAASLQVLGGAFSQMADPMMLLNQGVNDMEGLTKTYTNMLDNVASINKQTGELTIGGYDRLRMKAAAEAMGVSFDEMMNTARMKAKRTAIDQNIKMNPLLSSQGTEVLDKITSIAQFQEGKGFGVNIKGQQKLLSELTSEDLQYLQPMDTNIEQIAIATNGLEELIKKFYDSFMAGLSSILLWPIKEIAGGVQKIAGSAIKGNTIFSDTKSANDMILPSKGSPISLNSKDDVFAAKPGGAIMQALAPNNNVQRGFSNTFNGQSGSSQIHGGLSLNVNGVIKLTSDSGSVGTFNINELLRNQQFVKELTKIISNQMSRDENGGKYSGQLGRNSI